MPSTKRTRPLLGAHVSAAGGPYKALERGDELGAEVIQIFGASPRTWSAPLPKAADLKLYQEARGKTKVQEVYLHAAYLVNIGTAEPVLRARSIKNLSQHLAIAEALGAEGLIFHPGSGGDQLPEEAITKTIEGMQQVLEAVPGKAMLIMENTAGGGKKIGGTPEELGLLLKGVKSPRIKVCIDTAHAFEAGIIEQYTQEGITEFFDAWDEYVGLENVVALHINDSKTPYKSHHDRHENLGKGFIGLDGFRALAKEKRLAHTAWMLEVPGFEGMGPDKQNMDILKGCF